MDVEETRSVANVRIYIERVVGAVRQRYTILSGTLPILLVTKTTGGNCPLLDRII